MTNFRLNPEAPIPNNPFSSPLNPYVVGPWWPQAVGSGLGVDLNTGALYSTGGGGGGGIATVTGSYPIVATTSGTGVTVSIVPATVGNIGAVQLTSSLTNTSPTLALTAAAGKSLQDQINALTLSSTAGIVLVGTVDGSTGLIGTIVNNSYPSFVVGSPLPAAAPANQGTFVLVTTPGTMTPPNGVATSTEEGDWWYSDGVNWTLIPVGYGGVLPATATALGTVFACTPDTCSPARIPVVTLGHSALPSPYVSGSCLLTAGHVLIGCDATPNYSGVVGEYGTVLIGNYTCSKDNAIVIGGGSCAFGTGGVIIGNCSCNDGAGITIGNQLNVRAGTIALVSPSTTPPGGARLSFGIDNVVIGKRDCVFTTCFSPVDRVVSIGAQSGRNEMPSGAISIGYNALCGSSFSTTFAISQCYVAPLAIGERALANLTNCNALTCGLGNTAVGHNTGFTSAPAIGSYNTFLGASAGSAASYNSVVVGACSSSGCAACGSVVIGTCAAMCGVGDCTIAIGCGAACSNHGSGNIAIGTRVGNRISSSVCRNLVIGAGTGFNPPDLIGSCQLALGYNNTGGSTTNCYWLTGCSNMNIRPGAGIVDSFGSAGASGQVLSSTGLNSLVWTGAATIPAGALMNFAMATAPAGWLVANGDTIPNGTGTVQGVTANFSSLYAAIGTLFGGPGKLPDMRGMFTRGWDSAGGTARNCDPGRALGSQQGFALQTHCHEVNVIAGLAGRPEWALPNTACPSGTSWPVAQTGITAPVNSGGFSSNTGSTETRPVNVAVLPCIKY
jgi:hypothetical protein